MTGKERTGGARAVGLGCAGLLAAAFVLCLGYLWWANALPPPEADNRVLPSPNGFDACAEGAAKLQPLPATSPVYSADAEPGKLRPLLRRDRAALDELRQ